MRLASIKKRLAALERKHEQPPTPCLFLLRDFDGSIGHNGIRYTDLETALNVLKPHDYVIADVVDCSKPAVKAER